MPSFAAHPLLQIFQAPTDLVSTNMAPIGSPDNPDSNSTHLSTSIFSVPLLYDIEGTRTETPTTTSKNI